MKKFLKYFGFFALALVFLFLIYVAYNFYLIRTGKLVKWNNKWYTQKELAEKYPPQYYDVEAKNTPEEVYENFRQALLDDDREKALEYIVEDQREEYKQAFEDKEKLEKLKSIPEVREIKKIDKECYGNYCSYSYLRDGTYFEIDFVKNKSGFWEIKSI